MADTTFPLASLQVLEQSLHKAAVLGKETRVQHLPSF